MVELGKASTPGRPESTSVLLRQGASRAHSRGKAGLHCRYNCCRKRKRGRALIQPSGPSNLPRPYLKNATRSNGGDVRRFEIFLAMARCGRVKPLSVCQWNSRYFFWTDTGPLPTPLTARTPLGEECSSTLPLQKAPSDQISGANKYKC